MSIVALSMVGQTSASATDLKPVPAAAPNLSPMRGLFRAPKRTGRPRRWRTKDIHHDIRRCADLPGDAAARLKRTVERRATTLTNSRTSRPKRPRHYRSKRRRRVRHDVAGPSSALRPDAAYDAADGAPRPVVAGAWLSACCGAEAGRGAEAGSPAPSAPVRFRRKPCTSPRL